MNTKQIAEEAAERLRRLANDEFDWRDIQGTIQSAIEKATEPLYKLLDEQGARNWGIIQSAIEKATGPLYKLLDEQGARNWGIDRAAHTDVEQLRAERDHYKMLTQELGQELRAAHASEEK